LAVLLKAIGIPVRAVIIGAKQPAFDHIYLQANLKGKWVALDASDKKFRFGWEYPNPVRKEYIRL
jgi:hypothetical protein